MGYYKDSPPTMTAELAEVAAQAKSAVTERFTDAQKKQIVTQFYEKHAPGKSPAQIDEILAKPVYQKDAGFVKLCGGLERKYKESERSHCSEWPQDGVPCRLSGCLAGLVSFQKTLG